MDTRSSDADLKVRLEALVKRVEAHQEALRRAEHEATALRDEIQRALRDGAMEHPPKRP